MHNMGVCVCVCVCVCEEMKKEMLAGTKKKLLMKNFAFARKIKKFLYIT
jgi:hypothetical protein